MSTRFVNLDRQTPMLMPPDLRSWVPDDDQKLPDQIARREVLRNTDRRPENTKACLRRSRRQVI